jgi:hypothetical protein
MPQGFPDYWVEKAARTPLVIVGCGDFAGVLGGDSAAVWPLANLALFVPITLDEAVTIKCLFVVCLGASGNVDVGIYDEDGKRLASSGSTAVPATQQCLSLNIADTLLAAGRYYLAVACDSTVPGIRHWGPLGAGANQFFGVREVTASFPLPATVTFADNATRGYIPAVAATLQA